MVNTYDIVGSMSDNVNSPSHYNFGKLEAIEYIEGQLTPDQFVGYLMGNIYKYDHRWQYKNGVEDLEKSLWYKKRLVQCLKDMKE